MTKGTEVFTVKTGLLQEIKKSGLSRLSYLTQYFSFYWPLGISESIIIGSVALTMKSLF